MKIARSTRFLWLAILLAMAAGCTMGPAVPTATPVPTETYTPSPVPPTETPIPTNTSTPTITPTPGPVVIDDDFSADSGRFTCEKCVVSDGKLTMGSFAMVDSYTPFVAICQDCGSFTNYKMSVDTWYESGNSSFGWGLVIRQDEETTHLLAATSWQVYNIFSFDRSTESQGGRGYKTIIGNWSKGGLSAGRNVNRLEIVMQGSSMAVWINGKLIRNIDLKVNNGQVGLWVGNWETSANFDNFHFEEIR
jgi:hypothetical protein